LLQDLTFCEDEFSLDGLGGVSIVEWDVMGLGVRGEVGELGGIGAFLGDSYDVLMKDGLGLSIVRIESPSSSETSDSAERLEYEFSIEDIAVLSEAVDIRIVSVSEVVELIVDMVDIVRSEAALESPSEDAATPISCLCAPQWISGMAVSCSTISSSLSRTSRAVGRTMGALLSILRMRSNMGGIARKASSSCSNDAFSRVAIHVSILSKFAWKEESVREFFPPVLIFCLEDLCLTKS
jgi:hypothetical protein